MNPAVLNRIKRIIRDYFTKGKADKLKSDGYEEIKRLIWRNGGYWKEYKRQMAEIISSVTKELQAEFESGHLSKINDVIKSQLAAIIERTRRNFNGRAGRAQKIIQEALEKSYVEGGDWEVYARRDFGKLKLEERHIRTEIDTTKAALNNLKRYRDFAAAQDDEIHFRYEGPGTERPFCVDHLNKVYSLNEVSRMQNHFGQPAFAYCGGYNCRHRWSPVLGEKKGKLFIEKSWKDRFETASKNERKIMEKELDFARKHSNKFSIELNYSVRNKTGKDTDLIFEGKYAQLKQPKANTMRSLGSALTSKQADLIIIEMKELPDKIERVEGKINAWLKKNSEKNVILFIEDKIIREFKNDY